MVKPIDKSPLGYVNVAPYRPIHLKDSILNNTYVLDSTHIFITAYDSSGKILWKTDPFVDNKIEDTRIARPIITWFYFRNWRHNNQSERKKVIWIRYNHRQAGYLDLITGKFYLDSL